VDDLIRSHSSRSKRMEQRVSGVKLVPRLVRCAAVLDGVVWQFLPFALFVSLVVVVTIASAIVARSCYRVLRERVTVSKQKSGAMLCTR
jgi:hypothetical protein